MVKLGYKGITEHDLHDVEESWKHEQLKNLDFWGTKDIFGQTAAAHTLEFRFLSLLTL